MKSYFQSLLAALILAIPVGLVMCAVNGCAESHPVNCKFQLVQEVDGAKVYRCLDGGRVYLVIKGDNVSISR